MEQHPSFGAFTPDQIAGFLAAQPGKWHADVRKVDPLFGYENPDDAPLVTYRVTVSQTVKVTEHATFEVEAYGEKDAQAKAEKMLNDHKFSAALSWWEEDRDDTMDPFEIVDVEPKATA